MGLSAIVYCDCYEKGAIELPAQFAGAYLDVTGSLEIETNDLELEGTFFRWRKNACSHEYGKYSDIFFGNISMVGFVREYTHKNFPELRYFLDKFVFSGSHTGDCITVDELPTLKKEIDILNSKFLSSTEEKGWIEGFKSAVLQIIEASEAMRKPICF